MRIALLCATARGVEFARRLRELAPDAELALFSFREEPWEPPFLDDIRQFAASSGAAFFEGKDLESPSLERYWSGTRPDLMLAVSWRTLLPRRIYERPSRGTFVFHDSLLPKYRGFSPTLWAILNGESRTGVTLFKIDESVDAGDIADQEAVPIGPDDAIGEVLPRVTQAYLRILERSLKPLLNGTLTLRPQDATAATFTCRWTPDDLRIDWTQPAAQVHNLIRATSDPYPGAYTLLEGRRVRVWSSRLPKEARRYVSRLPGRVVEVLPGVGTAVLAGDGPVILGEVQVEGGERGSAEKLLGRLSYRLGP
jgi:methionyl-tRNA formyltransferase